MQPESQAKIFRTLDDRVAPVKDLMIPTPMKLKYIPVLKFTSHSFLKKRTISDKTYLGFEIVIIQNLFF